MVRARTATRTSTVRARNVAGAHEKKKKFEANAAAAASGGVTSTLASDFKVHRSTLYRWVKQQDAIKRAPPTKAYAVPTKRGPRIKYPELEKQYVALSLDVFIRAKCLMCLGY
ncbi:unnamed protein product [Phytophthora fragariaefolia]|uniref:Unnamed protein product n=1 Tax=Phytophthora fragariaefolia TaxID=1490495 RepID=A0A9W6X812_9STRA|nr:unnamed protein product [Phytophthora fragariaefolia]